MAETKSRLLYILKYLWQNTDAEHYATTGDRKLKTEYGETTVRSG